MKYDKRGSFGMCIGIHLEAWNGMEELGYVNIEEKGIKSLLGGREDGGDT